MKVSLINSKEQPESLTFISQFEQKVVSKISYEQGEMNSIQYYINQVEKKVNGISSGFKYDD